MALTYAQKLQKANDFLSRPRYEFKQNNYEQRIMKKEATNQQVVQFLNKRLEQERYILKQDQDMTVVERFLMQKEDAFAVARRSINLQREYLQKQKRENTEARQRTQELLQKQRQEMSASFETALQQQHESNKAQEDETLKLELENIVKEENEKKRKELKSMNISGELAAQLLLIQIQPQFLFTLQQTEPDYKKRVIGDVPRLGDIDIQKVQEAGLQLAYDALKFSVEYDLTEEQKVIYSQRRFVDTQIQQEINDNASLLPGDVIKEVVENAANIEEQPQQPAQSEMDQNKQEEKQADVQQEAEKIQQQE